MSDTNDSAALAARAADFVTFWKGAGPSAWFTKDPGFDARLRDRFLDLHERAARGELDAVSGTPTTCLAVVLLLDQFPRNAFRGDPRMYATDALARAQARRAVDRGFDERVPAELRFFFYLPFAHSESLEDQDVSVRLHERIAFTEHAIGHRAIVRRFGRFPHRNAILGRSTTSEEKKFLDEGGFAG